MPVWFPRGGWRSGGRDKLVTVGADVVRGKKCFRVRRVGADIVGESAIDDIVSLPQPEDGVSIVDHASLRYGGSHGSKVLPTPFAGEEILNKATNYAQCFSAPETQLWAGKGGWSMVASWGFGGEREDDECVRQHPQTTGVPSEVRLTPNAVSPLRVGGEQGWIQLVCACVCVCVHVCVRVCACACACVCVCVWWGRERKK